MKNHFLRDFAQRGRRRVEEGGKLWPFALCSSQCVAWPPWHPHDGAAAPPRHFLELGAELPCRDCCISQGSFAGCCAGLLTPTNTALVEIRRVPGRSVDLLLWHTASEGITRAASAGTVRWTGLATLCSCWCRKCCCLYLAVGQEPEECIEDACPTLLDAYPLAGPAMVMLL